MAIKTCPNGHHYNTDDNETCPYCERSASSSDFDWAAYNLTEMAGESTSKTMPLGSDSGFSADMKTERIGVQRSDVEDPDGKTVPLGVYPEVNPPVKSSEKKEKEPEKPVVGWLVCIEGPDKGKDFCMNGVKVTVGRKEDCAVILSDPKISRKGIPALIVYDDRKTHKFYLASGDPSAQNNVELCGNMLLGQSLLNPYDDIRIEDTVLVFVPFCGEDFFWN